MNDDLSGMRDTRRDQMDTPKFRGPMSSRKKNPALPKAESQPVRLYLDFATPEALLEYIYSMSDRYDPGEVAAYKTDILHEQSIPTGNRYILRNSGECPSEHELTWDRLDMPNPNERNHRDA